MVHLPPDSRLLASLVKQEQNYSSQLYNLLNASNSSLSALVIYASSSPTEISDTLKNVANALSGTDDAFRNYGEAINNWIDQLRSINRKEEEVATIGRQRELLVTRLIKVSQKSKASPQSLLHSASDSASNVSFKSFNSKVSAAQMELQACESHLATQERELEASRLSALKHGLRIRCQALVQCAWTWGELGRRCLSYLDELNEVPTPPKGASASALSRPSTNGFHDHDHDSAFSSLAPSQSASQIGGANDAQRSASPRVNMYSLNIPPPYLVPENGNIPVPSPARPQQPEVDGSSSSESEVQVEIHENPQFRRNSVLDKARGSIRRDTQSSQSSPSRRFRTLGSDPGPSFQHLNGKDRKSHGLFGGIASLFKTSVLNGKSSQNSGWDTRTNRNIRGARTDAEVSSDEERSNVRKLSKRRSRSAAPRSPILNGPAPLEMPSPTPINTFQQQKRKDSMTRTGTIRSSINEPPVVRSRERAITLTSTTGPRQSLGIPPERRLSADGRPPSLLNNDIRRFSQSQPATLSKNSSSPIKGEGLSRIAEDSSLPDGPSKRLESRMATSPMRGSSVLNRTNSASSSTAAYGQGRVGFSSTSTISEKKPLKSALRNTSKERDGSISPYPPGSVSSTSPAKQPIVLPSHILQPPPPRPLTPISPASSPVPGPSQQTPAMFIPHDRSGSPQPSISDTSSISSYETGRENFDGEDEGEEEQQHVDISTVPVLISQSEVVAPAPQFPTQVDIHEISSVTSGDTAIANGPGFEDGSETATRRRKSVRMSSLPPQVLERTPTQEDYEEGDLFTPKSHSRPSTSVPDTSTSESGWKSRSIGNPSDVWVDSSSEDEGYKAAKRALTRTRRHSSIRKK